MGYDTYITGELSLHPAITLEDLHAALEEVFDIEEYFGLRHDERGLIHTLDIDDSLRWTEAELDIANVCEALYAAGINATGTISGDGEDTWDVWRVVCGEGKAAYEQQATYWASDLQPLMDAALASVNTFENRGAVEALVNHLKEV